MKFKDDRPLPRPDSHDARYIRPLPSIFILSRPPPLSNCRFPVHQRGALQMPKVEVKQVRANMTINDMEPHWEAVVDYGAFEVSIPLPARYQKDADVDTQTHEFVEAMEKSRKSSASLCGSNSNTMA
jgi:hypothetical protein